MRRAWQFEFHELEATVGMECPNVNPKGRAGALRRPRPRTSGRKPLDAPRIRSHLRYAFAAWCAKRFPWDRAGPLGQPAAPKPLGEGGPRRVPAAESFRAPSGPGSCHLVHAEAFRPLDADGAGPAGQPYLAPYPVKK